MAEDEAEIQKAEVIIGPIAPDLPTRLRAFLQAEHGVSLGDITSRPYDRDSKAPMIARFILTEVRDDPAAHVNGPRLEQKIHALSAQRAFEVENFKALRAKAQQHIRRLLPYVPEMQVAQELYDTFKEDEVGTVIQDVSVALGSLRHTIASRNAAIAAGDGPPTHIEASA